MGKDKLCRGETDATEGITRTYRNSGGDYVIHVVGEYYKRSCSIAVTPLIIFIHSENFPLITTFCFITFAQFSILLSRFCLNSFFSIFPPVLYADLAKFIYRIHRIIQLFLHLLKKL